MLKNYKKNLKLVVQNKNKIFLCIFILILIFVYKEYNDVVYIVNIWSYFKFFLIFKLLLNKIIFTIFVIHWSIKTLNIDEIKHEIIFQFII